MPNTPAIFDNNNITLYAIGGAFGINTRPMSLLDVQNKAQANSQSLYRETGEDETISLPRTTISLGDFLGKYTPQCTGNIDKQEYSALADGVQGVIGFNVETPTYEIRGRTLYSLKIRPYCYANKHGAATSVETSSEEVWIMYGTDAQLSASPRMGVQLGVNFNTLTNIRIPSSTLTPFVLLIHIKITASSYILGVPFGSVTLWKDWVYQVNYNGLTLR